MRNLAILTLFLSLPMIHGCGIGTGVAGKEPPVVSVVVDHTPYRCPKVDERQRAALRKKVIPPKPDKPEGVSDRVLKGKINELRLALHNAQKTGLQIADQNDRCAEGASKKGS